MATFTMYLSEVYTYRNGHIGLDEYPIFDESYRPQLNKKIYEHFLNREIGAETVDMFLFWMRRKMNENMPYFNQLYKSAVHEIDPFTTFTSDSTSTTDGTSSSSTDHAATGHGTSTSDSTSRSVTSDTPQVHLSPDEDYATGAVDSISQGSGVNDSTSSDTITATGTQGGTTHASAHGFQGSQPAMLAAWRDTFLNIDMMVIEALEPCFMQLWSNGDEFTQGNFPFMLGYYGGF